MVVAEKDKEQDKKPKKPPMSMSVRFAIFSVFVAADLCRRDHRP